ncbi:MAG TPA: hypothetical protein PLU67_04115 [Candidatus Kapabacteria bacterium]|nr:hypothetical protein [Candidatus Kapabacteria bacterium]HOQ48461.1 hypothetical protein [Candidatus Kapabacteria bacterium]
MKIIFTKILESKIFSIIAAILIISFGLYKWGSFSRKVDEIGANALRKNAVNTVSVVSNISLSDFDKFLTNYYNENVYEFKKYSGYYQSREFTESDSLSYFFSVADTPGKPIVLKVHYTKLPSHFDQQKHSTNCHAALERIITGK